MRHLSIGDASVAAIVAVILAVTMAIGPLSASAQGDPRRGEVVAYTCSGCHGVPFYKNVYPTYSVPKLGGQNREYLVSALKAYRSGERQHPTMRAQAATLSDQDILDVSAYFVSIGENGS